MFLKKKKRKCMKPNGNKVTLILKHAEALSRCFVNFFLSSFFCWFCSFWVLLRSHTTLWYCGSVLIILSAPITHAQALTICTFHSSYIFPNWFIFILHMCLYVYEALSLCLLKFYVTFFLFRLFILSDSCSWILMHINCIVFLESFMMSSIFERQTWW